MSAMPEFLSPDHWISHLFSSQAGREGGVVRRKVRDVERFAGRDKFLDEMRRRGFPVVENAGQFVIFCNRERNRAGPFKGSEPEFSKTPVTTVKVSRYSPTR